MGLLWLCGGRGVVGIAFGLSGLRWGCGGGVRWGELNGGKRFFEGLDLICCLSENRHIFSIKLKRIDRGRRKDGREDV